MCNLEVFGLIFDHSILRVICMGLGKLNPEVIRKTYPRPIQATVGLLVKGLRALGP
jgi:hypothetical protein